MRRWAAVPVVICLLAAPVAAHFGWRGAIPLVALQAAMLGWISVAMAAPRWRVVRFGATAALFVITLAIARSDGPVIAEAVPHATVYLGFLALFALSLMPGRDAIITVVARRGRGTLTPALLAYTRHVTWAWCAFFLAQLALSLTLYVVAPGWWAAFVNLATVPAIAIMFACELAVRQWRHGIHRRDATVSRLQHALRVLGQVRAPGTIAKP